MRGAFKSVLTQDVSFYAAEKRFVNLGMCRAFAYRNKSFFAKFPA